MDDRRPTLHVLDYGHHASAERTALRIAAERFRQDQLNVVWYWVHYLGGPWYLAGAAGVGLFAAGLALLVTRGNIYLAAWVLCITSILGVRVRPHRPEW
jgi:hypothetical protein